MSEPDEMLGVREAARRLGVHENTVRNWADAGLLVSERLPSGTSRFRRFRARDIEQVRQTVAAGQLEKLARSATAITTGELARLIAVSRMYLDTFSGSNQMTPDQKMLYQDIEDIVQRYGS